MNSNARILALTLFAGTVSAAMAQCPGNFGDGIPCCARGLAKADAPRTITFSGNPLFMEFGSVMYEGDSIGRMFTADPSARVFNIDGREVLYLYASHDMEPARGCDRMDRYHVFSTEDLKTWTDHGEIISAADVQDEFGMGSDGFMWAPDCVYNPNDSLYYFYFPHPLSTKRWGSTWETWVATSRYPDRDFKIKGYIDGMHHGSNAIDPHVFVDDDGQPYIYNGGGARCFAGKLRKDDWTKLDGPMTQVEGLEDFHEASWVHKYNGKYYLSHSDNNSPRNGGNNMRYSTGPTPLGPWTPGGIYMEPTGIETNHGSIVKFKGKWYAFYHSGDGSGHGTLRTVCFDELKYNPDGSIQLVKQTRDPKRVVARQEQPRDPKRIGPRPQRQGDPQRKGPRPQGRR